MGLTDRGDDGRLSEEEDSPFLLFAQDGHVLTTADPHIHEPVGEIADEPIELSTEEARAPWGPPLRAKARRALARAEKRLGLRLNSPVHLLSFRTTFEFEHYLESRPTHLVAVARPERAEIVVLRSAWADYDPSRQEQVLVHEMTHLILGRRIRGRLPAWLDEGLAMITAGENSFEASWRVTVAGTLGGLLPMELLEDRVALGGESQELAYAQSLSMTRLYLQLALPDQPLTSRDPAPLARALADPETGPILLRRLWDPNFRSAFEIQWRRSYQTLWSWLAFLSGASFLWTIMSFLFLLAYWRKRRMARLIRERFEFEEKRDVELGTETPPWEYEDDEEK